MNEKEMKPTAKTEVRSWYHWKYPQDELWREILPHYTFEGLFKALDRRMYSYSLFGGDSVIRERVLCGLAEVMEAPVGEVYAQFEMSRNIDSRIWGDTKGMSEAIRKIYEVMNE